MPRASCLEFDINKESNRCITGPTLAVGAIRASMYHKMSLDLGFEL